MKKFKGLLRLFRLELPLSAGFCVVFGEWLAADGLPAWHPLLLGFCCGFFISSSAMILNDYFDLETDRINAPDRPFPSGAVGSRDILLLTVAVSILGLVAAFLTGPAALGVGVLFWLVGFLYNWKLKETGLPGNLMVSACVAITFIYGAIVVGRPWSPLAWLFGGMAFFFDLAEEIGSGAMDAEGDRLRGGRSVAILKGRNFAMSLSGWLFAVFVVLSLFPFLLGWLQPTFLFVILAMDAMVAFFTAQFLRSKSAKEGRLWLRRNYLGVVLCLIAFLFGRFNN